MGHFEDCLRRVREGLHEVDPEHHPPASQAERHTQDTLKNVIESRRAAPERGDSK